MKTWVNKTLLTRRLILPVMAVALALSFTTYEFIKPAYAKGPVASPTATPLDDNSIGALLSLDQRMEKPKWRMDKCPRCPKTFPRCSPHSSTMG